MPPIRIALVDDHKLFRKGLAALLQDDPDLEVLFDVASAEELFVLTESQCPDLVLLDIEMPGGMDGIEATEKLKKEYPAVRVIAITSHEEDRFISRLMELGASAYLLKNADMEEVETAIHSVMETGFYFSERVSKALLGALVVKGKVRTNFPMQEELTSREIDVLRLVCEEKNSNEIGELLHLSPRTVEGYRRNLLAKTGTRNLAGLVVFAIRQGYYELD